MYFKTIFQILDICWYEFDIFSFVSMHDFVCVCDMQENHYNILGTVVEVRRTRFSGTLPTSRRAEEEPFNSCVPLPGTQVK